MYSEYLLTIGILLSAILLVCTFLISIRILRRVFGVSIFQTVLGYLLTSIWLFLSLLNDLFSFLLVSETPQGIAFLTMLIIVAGLLLTNASIRRRVRFVLLQKVIHSVGIFLLGMFFVQVLIAEEIIVFKKSSIIAFQPVILFLLLIFGFFVLIYLNRSDLHLKDFIHHSRFPWLLNVAHLMGFGGMVLVVLYPVFSSFIQNELFVVAMLVVSRLMVQLAIVIFFFYVWDNPVQSLSIGRQLSSLFSEGLYGLALFGFETMGPTTWFSQGFSFFGETEKRSSRLLSLGIAAMVSLSQEDSYLEDSMLLPILSADGNYYTALAIGGWINDPLQKDVRMKSRSYVVGMIVLPKSFDWIFEKRSKFQALFSKYLQSTSGRSYLNPSLFYRLLKNEIMDIALRS